MALSGTLVHRKTRRLARALGIPVPCALGILEALWSVTRAHQPTGAIGAMSNQDIADEMFWEHPEISADALIETLVEKEWLDACPEHRLVVHDWWDHADDATHLRVARAHLWFVCGRAPKLTRIGGQERAQLEAFYARVAAQEAEDERTECTDGREHAHDVRTASAPPEPLPEPLPEPVNTLSLSARATETAEIVPSPLAEWAETPEEKAEIDRLDRHLTHHGKSVSVPLREIIRAKSRAKSPGWLHRAVEFTIERNAKNLLDPDEPRGEPPARAKQARPTTDAEAMFAMGKQAFASFGGDK